jgi:hypothetical protein
MNTENLQLNISNIEPTQVTQELRNISNRNNNSLNNNVINNSLNNNLGINNNNLGINNNNLGNNTNNLGINNNNLGINNNNSNLMIILKEMRQIFPLSVVIAFLIFLMLFIYIARF